ncbi:MAG: translocation/assembly module TamB domain-containing protein, partial [Bacteroidales bacterium]
VQEEEMDEKVPGRTENLGGLSLNLDVAVTPDASVQLIFDPNVGDIIETSGKGNLLMQLDKSNGFRMWGDVELQTGDYLFTLQNVINKRFAIEPGGRISFNGDPVNASIDLNAIYTTRCAPFNLWPGDPSDELARDLNKRIPVECHLNLQGELQSPTIAPGIEMPTANPEIRALLENSTGTEEDRMKQFLSVLVINNFYSVTGLATQSVGTGSGNLAGVTASELLSNQLSNWLSQISDDFDIGINYRPGDQVSSDEVELALSTQLLNDRILISGNLDVGGQETNPSTGTEANPYVVGDIDVEFKVTENVSVVAFNRARDEFWMDAANYKQGVGISFREDFDDVNTLLNRYKEGLTNRKKRKKKEPESDPDS